DAGRKTDLGLKRRIGAFHGAVGRSAGVEHLVPAPAMVVAAGRCPLLGVYRALGSLATDLLRGALDALGEDAAEPLAVRDHLQQPVGAVDIPPVEPKAHLLFGEVALLHTLHHPAHEPAKLVDVHAGAIDTRVEPADGLLLGQSDRPARSRPPLVLGLVHQLARPRAARHDLDVAVMHAAGVALMAAMVKALTQLGGSPLIQVHA